MGEPFTFVSLFSGVGGFDLGLERAGMTCVCNVEIDSFCRDVLGRRWPHVPGWDNVVTFAEDGVEKLTLPGVRCVAGGFPCQPHSVAGRRSGSRDERFLWYDFARIVRLLDPDWVLVENVPGLLSIEEGEVFGTVLRDLAGLGFDAEWDCIPLAAFGSTQLRYRVFIVAYSKGLGVRRRVLSERPRPAGEGAGDAAWHPDWVDAYPCGFRLQTEGPEGDSAEAVARSPTDAARHSRRFCGSGFWN